MYMLSRTRKKIEIAQRAAGPLAVFALVGALGIPMPENNAPATNDAPLRGSFELAKNYFPQVATFQLAAIYTMQNDNVTPPKADTPQIAETPRMKYQTSLQMLLDDSLFPSTARNQGFNKTTEASSDFETSLSQALKLLTDDSLFPTVYRNTGFAQNMIAASTNTFRPYNEPIYVSLRQDGPL